MPPRVGQPLAEGRSAAGRRSVIRGRLRELLLQAALNELAPDALWGYVLGGFAEQPDGTVTLRCTPSTEAAVFRAAPASGAWDVAATLTQPTEVVSGREEAFGPGSYAPLLVAELANARLLERGDLGHFGHSKTRGAGARRRALDRLELLSSPLLRLDDGEVGVGASVRPTIVASTPASPSRWGPSVTPAIRSAMSWGRVSVTVRSAVCSRSLG